MITRVELQQYRRMTDHQRRSPEAKAFRRKLEEALAALPSECRQLVVLRYCCRLSWVAVAMRMNYSRPQVFRINKKSLQAAGGNEVRPFGASFSCKT